MTDELAEIRRWVTEEAFLEERARQSFDWLLQRITELEWERAAAAKEKWEPWCREDGTPLVCGICHDEIPHCEPCWHGDAEGKVVYHETCSYQQQIKALSTQLRTVREALQEVARETVMNSHDISNTSARITPLATLDAPATEGIGTCTCHKSLYCPVHADAPAQGDLVEAAKNLLEACYQADAREELPREITGEIIDAVRHALINAPAQPEEKP